jgi:hypothetical protein
LLIERVIKKNSMKNHLLLTSCVGPERELRSFSSQRTRLFVCFGIPRSVVCPHVTLGRSFNLSVIARVVATLMCLLFVVLCLGKRGATRRSTLKRKKYLHLGRKQDPISGLRVVATSLTVPHRWHLHYTRLKMRRITDGGWVKVCNLYTT